MEEINALVAGLLRLGDPRLKAFERCLGVRLKMYDKNEFFRFYRGDTVHWPFKEVDLRIARSRKERFLVLYPDPSADISENQLGLEKYGKVVERAIEPDIPPEGAYSYLYVLGKTEIRFSFTAKKRQLRLVSMAWN